MYSAWTDGQTANVRVVFQVTSDRRRRAAFCTMCICMRCIYPYKDRHRALMGNIAERSTRMSTEHKQAGHIQLELLSGGRTTVSPAFSIASIAR